MCAVKTSLAGQLERQSGGGGDDDDDDDQDNDEEDINDDSDDDIYIMMKCLSRKMITFLKGLYVCLSVCNCLSSLPEN